MTATVWVGLVLAAVLALSGATKLRDRSSIRSAIRLLRLPRFLHAAWVAAALPVGELVLAVLLLVTPAGWVLAPAAAALVLFGVYLVIVARAMTFDPRPTCGCFGRIGDQSIRARTVVRNVLLVVLSGWFLADSLRGGSVPGRLLSFTPDDGWWLLAALLGCAVAVLVALPGPGTTGSVDRAAATGVQDEPLGMDGPRTAFPPATLLTHDRQPRSLADLTRESAVLLIGMDCTCAAVAEVAQHLPAWREHLAPIRLLVFTPTEPTPIRRAFDLPGTDLLLDHQYHLWDQWNLVRGMPSAVLLGSDGVLAGGPVSGAGPVNAFVTDLVDRLPPTSTGS